jgi:thioredoxin 1
MTQVTDETFQQEVLASDTPVLVDFYADWCAPCRAAAPSIDAIATEFEGKAKVVKVDVDKSSKFAVENQVRGIPNFIVFKGGKKIAQFVGWNDKVADEIRAALTTATASN